MLYTDSILHIFIAERRPLTACPEVPIQQPQSYHRSTPTSYIFQRNNNNRINDNNVALDESRTTLKRLIDQNGSEGYHLGVNPTADNVSVLNYFNFFFLLFISNVFSF